MLPLLADEDLHGAIIDGLRLHFPEVDLDRAQDVGLMHTPDSRILEFASIHNRVVVSHDRKTMTVSAQERVDQGLHMAGLIIVKQRMRIGDAIRHVGTLAEAGDVGDLEGRIIYFA